MKNHNYFSGLIIIVMIVSAVSGCCAACLPTSFITGDNANAEVSISGDTIKITGTYTDKEHSQYSNKFYLEKGVYILSWDNSNESAESFKAMLDANDGFADIPQGAPKGSEVLVVGKWLTPPGFYKLDVLNGDTYTVTISRQPTGAALPIIVDCKMNDHMAKALQLNPGTLNVEIRYNSASSSASIIGTHVYIYDNEGKETYLVFRNGGNSLTKVNTSTISVAGTYFVGIGSVPADGCSITFSQ